MEDPAIMKDLHQNYKQTGQIETRVNRRIWEQFAAQAHRQVWNQVNYRVWEQVLFEFGVKIKDELYRE